MNANSLKYPPSVRLKKRREFLEIQGLGRKVSSRHFLIFVNRSQGQQGRFGVTVSKKVDKRAVVRNRIKRRVREVLRLFQHRLAQDINIVVIARFGAEKLEFRELRRQILGALKQAGYLTPKNQ